MDASVDLLRQVARSTVTLVAEVPATHPSAAILGQLRYGTGTVVDDDGTVVTVNYTVVGAEKIGYVDIAGRRHDGVVVAHDYNSGVAVIRGAANDIPPVERGSSQSIECGADVFLTAAVDADERRVAAGHLTALDAFDASWEYRIHRALWMTCANPGLGGGPVCNVHGEMVGIVSLNLGIVGRSTVAIPAEEYFDFADDLIVNGRRSNQPRRAWIGVFCHALPGQAIVAGVIPSSPSDRAGFRPGDVVTNVEGRTIDSRVGFYNALWEQEAGATIRIDIERSGDSVRLAVESSDAEEFFD